MPGYKRCLYPNIADRVVRRRDLRPDITGNRIRRSQYLLRCAECCSDSPRHEKTAEIGHRRTREILRRGRLSNAGDLFEVRDRV